MTDKTEKKYNVRMPKIPGEQKTWTFTLSMSGMITACGCTVVALTLFFILGLLVGRGYRPEQKVPHLAEMMPKQEHGALVTPPEEAREDKVLTAQELTYPETLSKQPAVAVPRETASKQPDKTKATPQKPVKQQPAKQASPTPKTGEKIYDYTYQAASFRKEGMAATLKTKLANAGLKAAIETAETGKGTWYRVVVHHRGTPDSTNTMKGILAKFGIKRPLMKKKKLFKTIE